MAKAKQPSQPSFRLGIALLIVLGVLAGLYLYRQTPATRQVTAPGYPVLKVIDGDTIIVAKVGKVRYIGINAPELNHPVKGVEYYAQEALAANQRLVEGKTVRLEYDVARQDKYGRTLAYVYQGDCFVNAALLRDGFAQVMTIPPNVKHADYFRKLQREAQAANKGLWGAKRNTRVPVNQLTAPTNESGYRVNTKSKKFHRPSCKGAQQIKPANLLLSKDREQLLREGYTPCGLCRPN